MAHSPHCDNNKPASATIGQRTHMLNTAKQSVVPMLEYLLDESTCQQMQIQSPCTSRVLQNFLGIGTRHHWLSRGTSSLLVTCTARSCSQPISSEITAKQTFKSYWAMLVWTRYHVGDRTSAAEKIEPSMRSLGA